jgi:anti-anti-sigma factor
VGTLQELPRQWDGHLLLLHHDEAQRRRGVAAWVRRGLDLGEKILYTEPAEQPPGRSLRELLVDQQLDVGEALASGQLSVVVAGELAYDADWQNCVVESALKEGYPSVRWSGEAETAWSVMPRPVHETLELATDGLCRDRPVSVMCQYSTAETDQRLTAWCHLHGAGLRERSVALACIPSGVALSGEIDITNHSIVRSALTAATSRSRRPACTLDLSGLRFLDVRGADAIVAGTDGYRRAGGRVLIIGAEGPVARVLRILDIGERGGISMEEA